MSMTCYVATPGMHSLFTAHLRKTHRCVQRTEVVFQTKRNCVKSSDHLLERNDHKCPSTLSGIERTGRRGSPFATAASTSNQHSS